MVRSDTTNAIAASDRENTKGTDGRGREKVRKAEAKPARA
jgi:hypothetical protein